MNQVLVKVTYFNKENTFGPFTLNDAKKFLRGNDYKGGPKVYFKWGGKVRFRAEIIFLPELNGNFSVVPFPF